MRQVGRGGSGCPARRAGACPDAPRHRPACLSGRSGPILGNDTLTGPTSVLEGRLAVNGFLGNSVVTVGSGATLGGSGTVGGIIAGSGAIVAPGNSIGTLSVNGNVAFATGSSVGDASSASSGG